MKDTLRSKLFDSVEPYLTNGVTQPLRYRQIINDLHTAIVGDAIEALGLNRVINRRPPDISPEEELLPRTTRCTLIQLRSGHCRLLTTYQQRISLILDDHFLTSHHSSPYRKRHCLHNHADV